MEYDRDQHRRPMLNTRCRFFGFANVSQGASGLYVVVLRTLSLIRVPAKPSITVISRVPVTYPGTTD